MRCVFALVVCSACSFTPGRLGQNDDGDVDPDTGIEIDAGIDGRVVGSDAMWVDIETMQVPCLSANVPSTMTLEAGVTYRLRASGTCVIGSGPLMADAEYWDYPNTPRDIAANEIIDIGLSIDDPVMDLPKQPHWGAYDSSHVYVVDWVGAGAPIVALYHEQGPSNNSGNIQLVIQALQ